MERSSWIEILQRHLYCLYLCLRHAVFFDATVFSVKKIYIWSAPLGQLDRSTLLSVRAEGPWLAGGAICTGQQSLCAACTSDQRLVPKLFDAFVRATPRAQQQLALAD